VAEIKKAREVGEDNVDKYGWAKCLVPNSHFGVAAIKKYMWGTREGKTLPSVEEKLENAVAEG